MNLYLELTAIILSISVSIFLAQLARDFGWKLFQEKFFAALIGLILGIALYLIDQPFLEWFPSSFPFLINIYLLEKIHTMSKPLIFNRLGSIFLLILVGGSLAIVLSAFLLSYILENLGSHQSLTSIIQLVCIFIVPGTNFGLEREFENQLFMNAYLISVLFVYPLVSSSHLYLYFATWSFGLVIGVVIGIIGSLIIRLFKISKSWSVTEVLSSGLFSLLSAIASLTISGDPFVSLIVSGVILLKYSYISDSSQITRTNFYIILSLLIDILAQIWLGVNSVKWVVDYQLASCSVFIIVILFLSYLIALLIGRVFKLKSIKIADCVGLTIGGIRGFGSLFIINLLPSKLKGISLIGCLGVNLVATVSNHFLPSGKEESSYLISSNYCTKVKMILQNIEETYLLPIFLKETAEKSILSPKFNENSQRFDAGIQMRPENRDETSRELQALNLNITESEMQAALQLK